MLVQAQLAGVEEDVVDDVAARIVDDVVRLPVVDIADVEVVAQEIIMQGGGGAKLTDGEDVGFHIIQDGADVLVLLLGVVVGLVAVGIAALIVAVIQKVVLHHREGVLGFQKAGHHKQGRKENIKDFVLHCQLNYAAKLEKLARYLN